MTVENGTIKPKNPPGQRVDISKLPPLESAADFAKRDVPPLIHVVDGIITEGVGLLAGKGKIGKSWFSYQLGGCVAKGDPFLGHRTKQGTVLYFDCENPEPVRHERLLTMFPTGVPEDLFFLSPPPDGEPWIIGQGFEDVLSFYLNQKPDTRLVILDVLDTVADSKKRTEDPKEHAYRNVRYLKAAAQERHIAIVCITHFNKSSNPDADFMDRISGSHGWAAAADYCMGLSRKRGEDTAVFQTDGRTARGIELQLAQDDKTLAWKCQGTLEQMMEQKRIEGFKQNEITRAIVQAVKMGGGKWTGTSAALKAETIFDQADGLQQSNRVITDYIRGTTDLFRKVYGIEISDRNGNNSKTSEWVVAQRM